MARSIPKNPTCFLSILHNFTTFLSDIFVGRNLRDLSLPIPLRQGLRSSDTARSVLFPAPSVFISSAAPFDKKQKPVYHIDG